MLLGGGGTEQPHRSGNGGILLGGRVQTGYRDVVVDAHVVLFVGLNGAPSPVAVEGETEHEEAGHLEGQEENKGEGACVHGKPGVGHTEQEKAEKENKVDREAVGEQSEQPTGSEAAAAAMPRTTTVCGRRGVDVDLHSQVVAAR